MLSTQHARHLWYSGGTLALYAVGIDTQSTHTKGLKGKLYMLFPCILHFRKSMGVKHAVLPDGQPPTVVFTVLAQLFGPKTNETEMGAILFTKNGEGRNCDFDTASKGQC